MLPVEQVLDVNAWLEAPALTEGDSAAQADVEEAQCLPANAVDLPPTGDTRDQTVVGEECALPNGSS